MVRVVRAMVDSRFGADCPGTTVEINKLKYGESNASNSGSVIRLRYQPERSKYSFHLEDIEEILADYASARNLSETYLKELERYVWQFLKFVRMGRLESEGRIKAPSEEEYVVSWEVLTGYVNALIEAGYSSSSIAKRLQAVIIVLRRLNAPEVFLDILKGFLREVNIARRIEHEENTPILTLEDAKEFFRRLELLFKLKRLKKKQYVKALAFAILLFGTGRRVSEVVQIKVDDIDFEHHIIKIRASNTKEGKLLGTKGYYKVVFMTKEAGYVLRYYIKMNSKEIRRQKGYLFMRPSKKSLKDTFLHKIIKKSKNLENLGANLDFVIGDGLHRFEPKYFRKLFIQEWEREAEEKGMNNERVFMALRKLTGHRPSNDVYRINYGKLTVAELWKYYRELYYNLSVLTEEQKKMVGLLKENKPAISRSPAPLKDLHMEEIRKIRKWTGIPSYRSLGSQIVITFTSV